MSVTSTPTELGACVGEEHSTLVAEILRAATGATEPKRQKRAPESRKFEPCTVTTVEPAEGPLLGVME